MRGMDIFQKPYYREISTMRGRPMRGLPVQSLPEQRYHLGRKNYHVTKMYAVKGQNCQNEHCNFP